MKEMRFQGIYRDKVSQGKKIKMMPIIFSLGNVAGLNSRLLVARNCEQPFLRATNASECILRVQ